MGVDGVMVTLRRLTMRTISLLRAMCAGITLAGRWAWLCLDVCRFSLLDNPMVTWCAMHTHIRTHIHTQGWNM